MVRIRPGAGRPSQTRVRRGRRAVITVQVAEPGEVAVEGFGLLTFADPRTPATSDLLALRRGRYAVTFRPVSGRVTRLGLLIVR